MKLKTCKRLGAAMALLGLILASGCVVKTTRVRDGSSTGERSTDVEVRPAVPRFDEE